MATLPPLIIEAADPMVEDEVSPFQQVPSAEEIEHQVEATVREGVEARDAGAAIAHFHGLSIQKEGETYPTVVIDPTAEMFRRLAQKTDVIRLYARPAMDMDDRTKVIQKAGAGKFEMGAIVMNWADFYELNRQSVWDRPRIAHSLKWNLDMGVLPELEIFQVGSTWNFRWALEQGLLEPPFWVNLVSEIPGSMWAPATVESVQHRIRYFPKDTLWHTTAMCEPRTPFTTEEHNAFMMQVIAMGGNIRIGKEDRKWLRPGVAAKTNAELVELVVWMARQLGREVATPDQARKMLKLPRPSP